MKKSDIITAFSIILDQGVSSDNSTNYFLEQNHDDLVANFFNYITAYVPYIGNFHPEVTQCINDRGVDLLATGPNWKIGFQIKSQFDVSQDDFARNVKAQMSESYAHGLDKWYLIICCSLLREAGNYQGRVIHLINEISTYSIMYPAVYGPTSAIKYFNNVNIPNQYKFQSEFQRRSYEQTTIEQIQAIIQGHEIKKEFHIIDPEDDTSRKAYFPSNLIRFYSLPGWIEHPEQIPESIEEISRLISHLIDVPIPTRELFTQIIHRDSEEYGGAQWAEIRDACNLSDSQLNEQLKILEKYGLVKINYIEEENITYIVPLDLTEGDLFTSEIYWTALKEFSKVYGNRLSDFIVRLRFDLLDEVETTS